MVALENCGSVTLTDSVAYSVLFSQRFHPPHDLCNRNHPACTLPAATVPTSACMNVTGCPSLEV